MFNQITVANMLRQIWLLFPVG